MDSTAASLEMMEVGEEALTATRVMEEERRAGEQSRRQVRRNGTGCLTGLRKDWRRLRRSYWERLCSGTRTTTASG